MPKGCHRIKWSLSLIHVCLVSVFILLKQPDDDMFDSCVAMVTSILTDGSELEKAKQDMIDEAMSDCMLKLKDL